MTFGRVLRIVRIIVSLLIFAATATALTFGAGALAAALGWTGIIQIVPLVLAGSLSGIGLWVSATLILGRIYCSTACPLGTLMDLFTAAMRRSRRNFVFRHAAPMSRTRTAFFTIEIVAMLFGIAIVVSALDPYVTFERILAPIADKAAADRIATASIASAAVAAVSLAVVVALSWRRGRLLCNTVCPVGTALGAISQFAMLQFDIDTDRCTHCRRCEYVCKAQCINMADHTVDSSRCVVCFDCIGSCPDNAIRWTITRKRLSLPMMQRISTPAASTSILRNEKSKENATIS